MSKWINEQMNDGKNDLNKKEWNSEAKKKFERMLEQKLRKTNDPMWQCLNGKRIDVKSKNELTIKGCKNVETNEWGWITKYIKFNLLLDAGRDQRQAGEHEMPAGAEPVRRRRGRAPRPRRRPRGTLITIVADPDPSDPYVFGPPGSGSTRQRYGFGSFYHQAKTSKKTLWFLLFCDFFLLFIFDKGRKCTFK